MIEEFFEDARYAIRGLAKQRGFALVALASLSLGIGLNSAMFSVVNAVLLRPLPVRDPAHLARIYTTSDIPESTFSVPDLRDLQRHAPAFSGIAGHSLMFANVSRDGASQLLLGEVVTANYFDVLGRPTGARPRIRCVGGPRSRAGTAWPSSPTACGGGNLLPRRRFSADRCESEAWTTPSLA